MHFNLSESNHSKHLKTAKINVYLEKINMDNHNTNIIQIVYVH